MAALSVWPATGWIISGSSLRGLGIMHRKTPALRFMLRRTYARRYPLPVQPFARKTMDHGKIASLPAVFISYPGLLIRSYSTGHDFRAVCFRFCSMAVCTCWMVGTASRICFCAICSYTVTSFIMAFMFFMAFSLVPPLTVITSPQLQVMLYVTLATPTPLSFH